MYVRKQQREDPFVADRETEKDTTNSKLKQFSKLIPIYSDLFYFIFQNKYTDIYILME